MKDRDSNASVEDILALVARAQEQERTAPVTLRIGGGGMKSRYVEIIDAPAAIVAEVVAAFRFVSVSNGALHIVCFSKGA